MVRQSYCFIYWLLSKVTNSYHRILYHIECVTKQLGTVNQLRHPILGHFKHTPPPVIMSSFGITADDAIYL